MQIHIEQIAEALARGRCNVAFTGAGISTESGIPDYRSKGGIWAKYQPVYFDEFMSSRAARIEYWRRKGELYQDLVTARPNAAHLALARLHALGKLTAVITQNIDGLHQAAGLANEHVIELHGNTLRVRCMSCGHLSPLHEAQQRIEAGEEAPECPCGGYLKPDTISFGQSLPQAELQRAKALAAGCDVLLVIGSTLLVHPAAGLPALAKRSGAFLAIVNLTETPCDVMADVVINGQAGKAITALLGEVATRLGHKA